jgi:hypothetical protein
MTPSTSEPASWLTIDDQSALDSLYASMAWSDGCVVAFVGATQVEAPFIPADVSRSGHVNWDLRLLLYIPSARGSHLELLLVDCDSFSADLFRGFSLRGRVDSLKRVDVTDRQGQRVLRCSRLLYRFLDLDQQAARTHYGFAGV